MPQVSFPLKSYALSLKLAEVEIELSCLNWNWTVYIYIYIYHCSLSFWLGFQMPPLFVWSLILCMWTWETRLTYCVSLMPTPSPTVCFPGSGWWAMSLSFLFCFLPRFSFAYSHPFPTIWSFVSSAQSLSLFLSPLFISHKLPLSLWLLFSHHVSQLLRNRGAIFHPSNYNNVSPLCLILLA